MSVDAVSRANLSHRQVVRIVLAQGESQQRIASGKATDKTDGDPEENSKERGVNLTPYH